ncbi:unnamed protein product [Merluccius merluccius]
MVPLLRTLSLCLLVQTLSVGRGEFLEPPPNHAMRSLAEQDTVLPCRYLGDPGSVVVQVTWYKEVMKDGSREQIIAVHHIEGQTVFGPWSGRVRFQGSHPMLDSTLVITSTELTDEGSYTCHVSTFPFGNFEQKLSLTVWTIPISSLDPVVMREGEPYRLAAACRSVARPLPRLSWDTDLNGQFTNRTSDSGSVSSHYSVHPLRSMNGQRLDCLVWHPSLEQPRRLRNNLVVHYPPNAEVSGYGQNWFVGMEEAMLHCVSGGNPKPQELIWTRKGGQLPQGVIPYPNGTLWFGEPLIASDSGVYQCVAKNAVGSSKADVEVKVIAEQPQKEVPMDNLLLVAVGGAAGGLLLLMLIVIVSVSCHHKRRNKKLEQQLTVKDNEISNLVRQASIRKVNSDRMDSIEQMTEKNSLRVEGTIRTSMSSLGDQALSRDSRSTLSGGWGGGGGGGGGGGIVLDHLGRPALHNGSRRGVCKTLDRDEEKRLRVESFARSSTMSLQDKRMHPPLLPSPFPVLHSTEILRSRNGGSSNLLSPDDGVANGNHRNQQHVPRGCGFPLPADEEDEGLGILMCPENQGRHARDHDNRINEDDPDNDDPYGSETNSSLLLDAQHVHFQSQPHRQLANGSLRSQTRSPMPSPHASFIHKAQIV